MIEQDGKEYIIDNDGIMNEILHIIPHIKYKDRGGTYVYPELYICYDGTQLVILVRMGNPYLIDSGAIKEFKYLKHTIEDLEKMSKKLKHEVTKNQIQKGLEAIKKINRINKIDTLNGNNKDYGLSGNHYQTLAC